MHPKGQLPHPALRGQGWGFPLEIIKVVNWGLVGGLVDCFDSHGHSSSQGCDEGAGAAKCVEVEGTECRPAPPLERCDPVCHAPRRPTLTQAAKLTLKLFSFFWAHSVPVGVLDRQLLKH